MATDSDRRDFQRQIFSSLGGIGVGVLVAGLIALLIVVAVLAFNFMGDALRDAVDPYSIL